MSVYLSLAWTPEPLREGGLRQILRFAGRTQARCLLLQCWSRGVEAVQTWRDSILQSLYGHHHRATRRALRFLVMGGETFSAQ